MLQKGSNLLKLFGQTSRYCFASEVQTKVKTESPKNLAYYKDGQIVTRTAITLKKKEDIESYVIKTIQNYFRTTYKSGLNIDSKLIDHGLDSLDQIEIAMQIEQDLGYVISAETLPVLQKVKHFVNYIEHVEAYKKENHTPLP